MLSIDEARGRAVGTHLFRAFATTGVHGHTEMPEDVRPVGVKHGSLEHLFFITLTVSIDYQRDANALWAASRQTYEDPATRYLFCPRSLHEAGLSRVRADMQKHGLSKKERKDAGIWHTVGVTFLKKWGSDPRKFFDSCDWDAMRILERLHHDVHPQGGRDVADYPYLRGPKIGPLWVRMAHDNVGLTDLKNLDTVPIPVDIHVARATFATGVVHGQFRGPLSEAFALVRQAWFLGVAGQTVHGRPMRAMDVDEPLWHLSKYGCTHRDKSTGTCRHIRTCEAAQFCTPGRLHVSQSGPIEVDT